MAAGKHREPKHKERDYQQSTSGRFLLVQFGIDKADKALPFQDAGGRDEGAGYKHCGIAPAGRQRECTRAEIAPRISVSRIARLSRPARASSVRATIGWVSSVIVRFRDFPFRRRPRFRSRFRNCLPWRSPAEPHRRVRRYRQRQDPQCRSRIG